MNDLQAMLQGSIKQFADHENNAVAKAAAYLVAQNGLAYVLPGELEENISCAIHVDTSQLQNADGIYNSAFVQLDTQTDIFSIFTAIANGQRARVTCRFTGPAATVIPKGTRVGYPEVATVAAKTLPALGYMDVICESQEYTVDIPAGVIDTMIDTIAGVTVENLVAGTSSVPALVLVYYRGLVIGINKSGTFNNVAKTYHYAGEIIQNKNKGFILATDSIIETMFLSNSTAKWILFGTYCGVPCYPSFLTPTNLETAHMVVEITSTIPMGMVSQTSDILKQQSCRDSCRIHLINGTLNQAQDIATALYEQAREIGLFGCIDFPAWVQTNDDTQPSFSLKANKRVMDMRINYVLESGATGALKYITDATALIAAV